MKGEHIRVRKADILEINNGKAQSKTKRWYDIVCDQCESDYEEVLADKETNIPESYIVCNQCNKITYLKDLRDMQENI